MIVVDASVAIDALRGDGRALAVLSEWGTSIVLTASEVTRFEVLAGTLPHEESATERFFSEFLWVPVTEEVSRRAASLARRFRAGNRGIDDADYLVAATALELDADLLTTNVRHFPMFPELRPAY